ncbi:hypothetical protein ACLMJK_005451 [Lecanora helva]
MALRQALAAAWVQFIQGHLSFFLNFLLLTIHNPNAPYFKSNISYKHPSKPLSTMADNTNPGNFANRAKDEVQNIAQKGGQSSHAGGFANMDPDKQKDIASQGGKASSGSFEPGSEAAKEAGRKGGSAS